MTSSLRNLICLVIQVCTFLTGLTQLVKNPLAVQETLVQFLDWEDPLEKGWATHSCILGFPWWLSGKESDWQYRRHGFNPWVREIPWRWAWQPTPIFLPVECPRTKEPSGLQSMGSQRVGYDRATKHSTDSIYTYTRHF